MSLLTDTRLDLGHGARSLPTVPVFADMFELFTNSESNLAHTSVLHYRRRISALDCAVIIDARVEQLVHQPGTRRAFLYSEMGSGEISIFVRRLDERHDGWRVENTSHPNGPFLSTITTADKCSLKTSFGTPTTTTGTGGTQQTTSGGDAITVWQDPLVLDLNGDGVRTSGASSPVRFDMQGDGQKELLTWTDPNTEEGFLWIDRNHDGVVTDGTELFGVGTDLPAGVKAHDGFEALAMYDDPAYGGNGDGVISKGDDI